MKRILKPIIAVTLLMNLAFARGVGNNSNLSSEYVRTLNRNAATDIADIAAYNPAGTVFMEDGIHLYFSNQILFKEYRQELSDLTGDAAALNGQKFKSDNTTWFIPSAYVVGKWGDMAGHVYFNVPGGGGSVEYNDGVATTAFLGNFKLKDPKVTGSNIYYSGGAGFSYKFADWISASIGGRVIYSEYEKDVEATSTVTNTRIKVLDYKESALGFSGIVGVNIKPIKGMNIGLRYETPTRLEFDVDKKENIPGSPLPDIADPSPDGSSFRKDLASVIATGVSYMITDDLRAEADFTLYLNTLSRRDRSSKEKNIEDEFKTGFDVGLMFEYSILKNLKVSVGGLYNRPGSNPDTYNENNPTLNGATVAGGVFYRPIDALGISVGYLHTIYQDNHKNVEGIPGMIPPHKIKLSRDADILSIGATYSF